MSEIPTPGEAQEAAFRSAVEDERVRVAHALHKIGSALRTHTGPWPLCIEVMPLPTDISEIYAELQEKGWDCSISRTWATLGRVEIWPLDYKMPIIDKETIGIYSFLFGIGLLIYWMLSGAWR